MPFPPTDKDYINKRENDLLGMPMPSIVLCFFVLAAQTGVFARPSAKNQVQSLPDAFSWLSKYGYNPCLGNAGLCSISASSLLKTYQRNFHLKPTGILDEATKRQMNRPRCGNRDRPAALLASSGLPTDFKWTRPSLNYSIQSYPSQLSRSTARSLIADAFALWLEHIPLTIEETCAGCPADLVLEFASGTHADEDPFDGVGGTLAHAFLPEDGRVHFDRDEPWTDRFSDDTEKKNLFLVAVHEIGHALGLGHSFDERSIMYPTYQFMSKSALLPSLDREAIQSIYGTKPSGRGPQCSRFLDGAFQHPDGTLHTFAENTVRRYFPDKHQWEERAAPAKQLYRSLPVELGAAVYNPRTKQAVFFTQQYLYVYEIDAAKQATLQYLRPLPKSLRSPIYGALYYRNEIQIITERSIASFQLDRPRVTKERPLQSEFPRFNGTLATAFSVEHLHHFFTTDGLVYVWNEISNSWKTFAQPMESNWFACSSAPPSLMRKHRRPSPQRQH